MSRFDVDLFVIGGGSGGVRAARVAAEHGARVAIAEADRWGGTCVIRGCVPKKLLVYASEISRTLADARGQGWTIPDARHDWATLMAAKDKEIARLSNAYVDRLRKAGAEVITGRGRILDPHTIEITGRTMTAAHLLIATGGRPRRPSTEWITSDEVFHLPSLPPRIAILGGGYVAVEFAHIFAGLGSQVTLIHRDSLVLRGFDPEVRKAVTDNLAAHGVDFLHCKSFVRRGNHILVGDREIEVDVAMAAIGRDPVTAELGLDAAGVKLDERGAIVVDDECKTNLPNVWAIGDVVRGPMLAHKAEEEGVAVAERIAGQHGHVNFNTIPWVIYTSPEIAWVGQTEQQLKASGRAYKAGTFPFLANGRARALGDTTGMVKFLADAATDEILGVHMVGPQVSELISEAVVAMEFKASSEDIARICHAHPSLSEATKEAALAVDKRTLNF
jgi:dihydrolipoamide dehydrogenase